MEIHDNNSPTPVNEYIQTQDTAYKTVNIINNITNIGGNANILRCIEFCKTEWIWVLGDDDLPTEGAIQQILKDISTAGHELLAINYQSELYKRHKRIVLRGSREFLRDLDSLSSVMFISSTIFRATVLRQHLRFAYAYLYSSMPHIIALYYSLKENSGIVLLSTDWIVHKEEASAALGWSVVNGALAFPTLLDLPITTLERKAFEALLHRDVYPDILGLVRQLLHLAIQTNDYDSVRWSWRQICTRRFSNAIFDIKLSLFECIGIVFYFPKFSHWLVEKIAITTLSDKARFNQYQDRESRL